MCRPLTRFLRAVYNLQEQGEETRLYADKAIIYSRRHKNSDIYVSYHSVLMEYIPSRSLFNSRFACASNQLTRRACLTDTSRTTELAHSLVD
jgi:hypothetical protein